MSDGNDGPPPRDRSPERGRDGDRERERSRERDDRGAYGGGYGGGGGSGGGGGRKRGTACRFNTERGFGFISPESGGDDIFCHFSQISDGNALEQGKPVEYDEIFDDSKGKSKCSCQPRTVCMRC
jgi:cold shock CspA family protein